MARLLTIILALQASLRAVSKRVPARVHLANNRAVLLVSPAAKLVGRQALEVRVLEALAKKAEVKTRDKERNLLAPLARPVEAKAEEARTTAAKVRGLLARQAKEAKRKVVQGKVREVKAQVELAKQVVLAKVEGHKAAEAKLLEVALLLGEGLKAAVALAAKAEEAKEAEALLGKADMAKAAVVEVGKEEHLREVEVEVEVGKGVGGKLEGAGAEVSLLRIRTYLKLSDHQEHTT